MTILILKAVKNKKQKGSTGGWNPELHPRGKGGLFTSSKGVGGGLVGAKKVVQTKTNPVSASNSAIKSVDNIRFDKSDKFSEKELSQIKPIKKAMVKQIVDTLKSSDPVQVGKQAKESKKMQPIANKKASDALKELRANPTPENKTKYVKANLEAKIHDKIVGTHEKLSKQWQNELDAKEPTPRTRAGDRWEKGDMDYDKSKGT